jgi:P pilus assembly chaperone PapD
MALPSDVRLPLRIRFMKKCLRKIPAVLFQGVLAGIIVSSLPVFVFAASFDIKPVRLELSKETPLEKLVIKNVSDKEFPLQVRVYEWNQNEKGEDVYTETDDIIVFPKIMTIKCDEERYIRVGSKVVPGTTEKTAPRRLRKGPIYACI